MPATVIAARLRPQGFTGSLTILKDHLRRVRPTFLAVRAYQRTSYQPGELAQTDWWQPGITVPVRRGQSREVFGLVTRAGPAGRAAGGDGLGQRRLHRRLPPGRAGHLVEEVAALYGQWLVRPAGLRPCFPQGKGFIERVIQYLKTSFLRCAP